MIDDAYDRGKARPMLVGCRERKAPVARFIAWWTTNGFLKRTTPLKGIVDASFVEEAAWAVPEK